MLSCEKVNFAGMYILGISAYYHDSAAVLLQDATILVAVQEERFTRIKNDASFPSNAIQYCIQKAGIELKDIDAITFYDKPLLKFERIVETFLAIAPKGFRTFVQFVPLWLKEKLFLKSLLKKELHKIAPIDFKKTKLLFTEHHLSHAAACYFTSTFKEAAIVTIDGVGEWATTSICYGSGTHIEVIEEVRFPDSIGLLYSSFTYFLGFKVNSAEYKVMGLAPYASRNSEAVQKFYLLIKNNLIHCLEDGSYRLNMEFFSFHYALRMIEAKKWETLFGLKRRVETDELNIMHAALASALQIIVEEMVYNICENAKKLTGSDNLCLSGGVALNCVANSMLAQKKLFKNIFIQPAAGDAGGALGAALATHYIYFNNNRNHWAAFDPYLGYSIDENEVKILCTTQASESYTKYPENDLLEIVAKALAAGKIVGWVQGPMEWGPRALGNRSILASATVVDMQQKINLQIKKREGFRPFAPVVLEEDAKNYFEIDEASPYMMYTVPLIPEIRKNLPASFEDFNINQKLSCHKSNFPAITHVDFSARVQTVNKEQNRLLYLLLQRYKKETGDAILVNTSFNVRGEPIVMNAQQAFECFKHTDMDLLVINDTLFRK